MKSTMISINAAEAKKRLFGLIRTKALFKERVVLSSGKESNFCLDGWLVAFTGGEAFLRDDFVELFRTALSRPADILRRHRQGARSNTGG